MWFPFNFNNYTNNWPTAFFGSPFFLFISLHFLCGNIVHWVKSILCATWYMYLCVRFCHFRDKIQTESMRQNWVSGCVGEFTSTIHNYVIRSWITYRHNEIIYVGRPRCFCFLVSFFFPALVHLASCCWITSSTNESFLVWCFSCIRFFFRFGGSVSRAYWKGTTMARARIKVDMLCWRWFGLQTMPFSLGYYMKH